MSDHTLSVVLLAAATGLLGAVIGGLAQVVQDWQRRRVARQVAARLVYADLEVAYQYFDKLQRKVPTAVDKYMDRHLTVWAEQAPAFADTVGLGDFHIVAGAFAGLTTYVHMVETAEPDDVWILEQTEHLDRARRVAWKAGGAPLDRKLKTSLHLRGPGSEPFEIVPPGLKEP